LVICPIVVEKNDSSRQKITPKHVLATSAYASDNFPWVELEEGVYTWDGALLSNRPFSEVIDASPVIQAPVCLIGTISSGKVSLGRN
jgi:NTE family protein